MGVLIHGHAQSKKHNPTRTYSCWNSLRSRCRNLKDKDYPKYGGRGITVCARWDSFVAFLQDMGICPPGHEIDRIKVNGNYEPGNCRWVTEDVQANNKQTTVVTDFLGEPQTISSISKKTGVPHRYLRDQISEGSTAEKAVERFHGGLYHKKDKFRADNSKASKLTSETVSQMKAEYNSVPNVGTRKPFGTVEGIAIKYGVTRSHANRICRGQTNWG